MTGGTLGIVGTSKSGEAITIAIAASSAAVGTFTIGGVGGSGLSFILADLETASTHTWQAFTSNGSGTLTLTVLTSSRAAGSFSFVGTPTPNTGAVGTKTVTSGSFDITF